MNYADDFLVLASSSQLLDEPVEALVCAVGDLLGGHFDLKVKSKTDIEQGVDFLGHRFRSGNGQIKVSPTPANMDAFYGKLDRLDTKFGKLVFYPGGKNVVSAIECAAEMHEFVKGWMATFAQCDDVSKRWAIAPLETVADALNTLGVTAAQIEAAVEPLMKFETRDYAPSHS